MSFRLTLPTRLLPIVAIAWLSVGLAVGGTEQTPTAETTAHSDTAPGLGVFGNALGLHGTLQVKGDLMLKQADIIGEGELVLQDSQPHTLIAQASSVKRLVIDNPAGVTLQGDLAVGQRLTIRHGTFDVRQAHLHVADSGQVIVLNGAQLRQTVWLVSGDVSRPAQREAGQHDGWLTPADSPPDPGPLARPVLPDNLTSPAGKPKPFIDLHSPPPDTTYIVYR